MGPATTRGILSQAQPIFVGQAALTLTVPSTLCSPVTPPPPTPPRWGSERASNRAASCASDAAAGRAADLAAPPSDIHASADYRRTRTLTRVLTGRALRRAIARLHTLSPGGGEGRVRGRP
jgi:hypothetical protein